ncbi:hypothetical protein CEXT_5191 [Caerostris extrusa]|uniref:Uncharacterized protein n=1 Tax=Caerostris extrusa TaxID=172846 RepID=A0AAV4PLY1_CAEEX|nr:hypothetical protein CEXT_5191 [Caerostris extrusa]
MSSKRILLLITCRLEKTSKTTIHFPMSQYQLSLLSTQSKLEHIPSVGPLKISGIPQSSVGSQNVRLATIEQLEIIDLMNLKNGKHKKQRKIENSIDQTLIVLAKDLFFPHLILRLATKNFNFIMHFD